MLYQKFYGMNAFSAAGFLIFCIFRRKILEISQDKFGSRILEIALRYASNSCLREMVAEILDGYEPDQ